MSFGISLGKTASPAATSNGRRQQSRIFFHSTEVQQWAAWSLLHAHTKHLPGKGHWCWSRVAQYLVIRTEGCTARRLNSVTLSFTIWWLLLLLANFICSLPTQEMESLVGPIVPFSYTRYQVVIYEEGGTELSWQITIVFGILTISLC